MTQPAKVDLHALANAPGYGTATRELLKAGLLDPADEEGLRPYVVEVTARLTARATLTVRAKSRDEACDMAAQQAEGMAFDEFDDTDPVVTGAEVTHGWHE